jgi:hypothetical protein
MTQSHLRSERHGAVALLLLDHPPVNGRWDPTGLALRGALETAGLP